METPKKTTPRRWRRLTAKAMKRSRGQCEWVRPDLNLRCLRAATVIDVAKPDDDVTMSNVRALCEYHQLMAERSREVAKFLGIRVRPPREGDYS